MAGEVELKGKGQALRLSVQQELGGGPLTIFGEAAQKHDLSIREVTAGVLAELAAEFPNLEFRQRTSMTKREINEKLHGFDERLGQTLFVESAGIRPDGGVTEVRDRHGNWRIVLVGESKHQGNDVEKIMAGIMQGKNKDQDFMAAGNAIERMHKNVLELRNFMLDERYFPYVVFLQGSNFAIESFEVAQHGKGPEGLWQRFFEKNPWIFGYSLSLINFGPLDGRKLEQAVRGRDLTGPGKRVDALLRSRALLSTTAFVELKHHRTNLVVDDQYRPGIWQPSKELSGAVAQIQGTVAAALEQWRAAQPVEDADGEATGETLYTTEPRSFVICGRLGEFEGEHGVNERKFGSFERFRRNLLKPEVVTFDELYERACLIVQASEPVTEAAAKGRE